MHILLIKLKKTNILDPSACDPTISRTITDWNKLPENKINSTSLDSSNPPSLNYNINSQ
jgi:hypothetical protein